MFIQTKNIFRLMAVLLLANECLVVSCKKRSSSENTVKSSAVPDRFSVENIGKDYDSFKLCQRESYKFGSKDKELEEFYNQAAEIRKFQDIIAKKTGTANARLFHAKSHGCLTGKLHLDPNRVDGVSAGMFSKDGSQDFNVFARFSNGVGTIEHDRKPDVRGLAIKIFGAEKGGGIAPSMDILNTNSPNPFAKDQAGFMDFARANVVGPLAVFLAKHPVVATRILKVSSRAIFMNSLATETYWSGHPYAFGHSAAKFIFKPHGDSTPNLSDAESITTSQWLARMAKSDLDAVSYNAMRTDLKARASDKKIAFDMYAQLDSGDDSQTPIEDTFVEWTEAAAEPLLIGQIEFDQQNFENSQQEGVCDSMSFNPGRYHPAHRPLSNMGRGRIFAYQASAKGRGADFTDPDEQKLFDDLRQANKVK